MENGVRVVAIGNVERLPAAVRRELEGAIERTRDNHELTVGLCVSYGGREDIVQAMRALGRQIAAGKLDPESIDENTVSRSLGSAMMPDPDLLIRTSGEMRISNFYLWQLAYTEIYVTETLWPDFREAEYVAALCDFQRRERRFGRVLGEPEPAVRAGRSA
jgi:undecaprenyl diphosphate synthase